MTYLSKDGIKTSQSSSFPQEPTPKHNIDSPAACRWIQIPLHTNVAWARPNSGIIIWSVQPTGDVTSRQVIGPHIAPLGGKRRYWSIPSMADRGHAICHNNACLHGYGYVMTTGENWCRQSTHKTEEQKWQFLLSLIGRVKFCWGHYAYKKTLIQYNILHQKMVL